jgi:Pentapeptide repeats (8 copies)
MPRRRARRRSVWKGPGLQSVDWRGQDLRGRDFSGYGLRRALLVDADLADDPMQGVDLAWADPTRCNLAGADLYEADLRGADLSGARLDGANRRDAVYNEATRWPEGFLPHRHGAVQVTEPVWEHDGCRELLVVAIVSPALGLAGGHLYGRYHHALSTG